MALYTITLQQILQTNHVIFDFDYPIFNEEFREQFQNLFIDYFLLDEIGQETIGQFKHSLKTKLNIIMPYYNKLYETQEMEQRILDNYDVTEEYTREVSGDSKRILTGDRTIQSNSTNRNLYKDTPKTKVDIDNFDTVTNLSKNINEDSNTSNINDIEDNTNNAIEKYNRTMKGNIGVQTDSDAIIKYWQSLRNITLEIFENELSSLFMGVF